MHFIGRPSRQRPWWLAVGVLTFVLLFTFASAAPAIGDGIHSGDEIHSASDARVDTRAGVHAIESQTASVQEAPRLIRAPSLGNSPQSRQDSRLDAPHTSQGFTFAAPSPQVADEVTVDYRPQKMGVIARLAYARDQFLRPFKSRSATNEANQHELQRDELIHQQAEERRIARLQPKRGEVQVAARHQPSQEELEAASKARVLEEAEGSSRAGTSQRLVKDASIPDTSRSSAARSEQVHLSRSHSSPRNQALLEQQASGRVKQGAGTLNDALYYKPVEKVEISGLSLISLHKRSGASTSGPGGGASTSGPGGGASTSRTRGGASTSRTRGGASGSRPGRVSAGSRPETPGEAFYYHGEGWKILYNLDHSQILFDKYVPHAESRTLAQPFNELSEESQKQVKAIIPGVEELLRNGWNLEKLKKEKRPVIGTFQGRHEGAYTFKERFPQIIEISNEDGPWRFQYRSIPDGEPKWTEFQSLPRYLQDALKYTAWSGFPRKPWKDFVIAEPAQQTASGLAGALNRASLPRVRKRSNLSWPWPGVPASTSSTADDTSRSWSEAGGSPTTEKHYVDYHGEGWRMHYGPDERQIQFAKFRPHSLETTASKPITQLDPASQRDIKKIIPAVRLLEHNRWNLEGLTLETRPEIGTQSDLNSGIHTAKDKSPQTIVIQYRDGHWLFEHTKKRRRTWSEFGRLPEHLQELRFKVNDRAAWANAIPHRGLAKRSMTTSQLEGGAETVEPSRGAAGSVSVSLHDQSGPQKFPILQKRVGRKWWKKKLPPYRHFGTVNAGSSSARHSTPSTFVEDFSYPGKRMRITRLERDPSTNSYLFHHLNEDQVTTYKSGPWSQLSRETQTKLMEAYPSLHGVIRENKSVDEAKNLGVPVASDYLDRTTFPHPEYPPETIRVLRDANNNVVFARENGVEVRFAELPSYLRSYIERNSRSDTLLEALRAYNIELRDAARHIRRAIDTDDDNAHQLRRRAQPSTSFHLEGHTNPLEASNGAAESEGFSSLPSQTVARQLPRLQKRTGRSFWNIKGRGSSGAGSSRAEYSSIESSDEPKSFIYPGQQILITRERSNERFRYRFHVVKEDGTGTHTAYWWEDLPSDLKAGLKKNMKNLEEVANSALSAEEAQKLGVTVASRFDDLAHAIPHPLHPQEVIELSRTKSEFFFKRPVGRRVKFQRLPKHIQTYMQSHWKEDSFSQVMESINEEELRTIRHDLFHKRAVDTDAAKDHQVQRRAGSSTSSDVDASTIPPLRTLRYPGERIVLTEYNGELIVNVLDPQQVMWYQNTPWSQLSDARKQQLESFLLEQSSKGNNIEKAQDTSDRSKWFVDPEKPEEDIEIKNIGNKMWFQRHVNSRAHEPVEFDGLPEHLKHWIDNSPIKPIVEDAKLKIQEAAKEAADTGPHIRKRAISDREDSEKALRPRAGTGSVPNSTPGEVGTSSAPQGNEVTAQRRRFGWLKTIVTGKSSSSSSSKAFAREPLRSRDVEFPGSGISFSLAKHGEVLFWHSRGFEEDTMMFKNFDQLNEKEKELVTNSQLFQDFTSKLKTAEVYDGSYDTTKTVLWPDKGEEKIIQTDWGDKYMYTRQTLKGEPLGEKPFYLLHELPGHLLEFVKTKLPEASKPHIRKRADSDEVMPTAEKVKFT